MHIQVLTIFPQLFSGFLESSLIGKAIENQLLQVKVRDLRDWTTDRHRTVDDEPYGGGGGMVMTAPPWIRAVGELTAESPARRILLSPQGETLTDRKVRNLSSEASIILMCGRYEGLDERVRETVVDDEISIGDYVLSGGEVPAMVLIETLSRQIPGVIGLADSVENDSFRQGLLDHPHYTRPATVAGLEVPQVLTSGNHAAITDWRTRASIRATLSKRPDLLQSTNLTAEQERIIEDVAQELAEAGDQGVERGEDEPRKVLK